MKDILKKIVSITKAQEQPKKAAAVKPEKAKPIEKNKISAVQKKRNIEAVNKNNREKKILDELKKLLNV
jgi:uncharacterized membrane protein YgaE (UPF0421/DUF939 family)